MMPAGRVSVWAVTAMLAATIVGAMLLYGLHAQAGRKSAPHGESGLTNQAGFSFPNGQKWDFGRVKPRQELVVSFLVENKTGADIDLGGIQGLCSGGEVDVQSSEPVLAPGSLAEIRVRTTASGTGSVTRTVSVVDPTAGTMFQVLLTYEVPRTIRLVFDPAEVLVGRVCINSDPVTVYSRLVAIQEPGEAPLEVTQLSSNAEHVRVARASLDSVTPTDAADWYLISDDNRLRSVVPVSVTLDPGRMPPAQFRIRVVAETSLGDAEFFVAGQVCPELSASPPRIVLDDPDTDDADSEVEFLSVSECGGHLLELSSVVSNIDGFRWSRLSAVGELVMRLRLSIPRIHATTGDAEVTVVARVTDSDRVLSVRIPVTPNEQVRAKKRIEVRHE